MAVADILIGGARVKYSAVGAALPNENEISYGEAWGGGWTDVGYTITPLSVSIDRELYEVMVEQLSVPVKRQVTKDDMTVETTLAEFTGDNALLAFNGATLTETAAIPNVQVQKEEIEWGGSTSLDVYQWGFEGLYKDDSNNEFPVRLYIYRGEAVLNGQLQFSKSKEAGIPLQIKAQPDTTKAAGKQIFKLQKVLAAAGS